MSRRKFYDYGIRPKGSYEVASDVNTIAAASSKHVRHVPIDLTRKLRSSEVYGFLIKIALKILPPEQRRIFYSVWMRSGGRMNKGVMEFSRKIKKSHFTSYNNYYKAIASIRTYLKKTGYDNHIVEYLQIGNNGIKNNTNDRWSVTEDDLL